MSLYLAIDIGGTFIKSAFVSDQADIQKVEKQPTPENLEDFLNLLKALVDKHKHSVAGLAISCPGKIDPARGYVYIGGSLAYLKDLPLQTYLQDYAQLPCALMNDAKAALLAEVWKGGLQGVQNALILTLGTGLGGAILINGQPLQGQHFQAGELSFVLQAPDGADYGNWWASLASGVTFVEKAAALLDLPDKQDGKAVFEALASGQNPQAQLLFESYCRDLALIIYNLHTILDLEKILIGGGISSQPILLQEIQKAYREIKSSSEVLDQTLSDVEIDSCTFKNEANLLGAVCHLLNKKDSGRAVKSTHS